MMRPIRWWLATVAAAAALPFIVLLVLMFAIELRRESAAARTTALRVARSAGAGLLGLRNDSLALLQHMAGRPSIQNFATEPCDSMFAIVDFFPQYANLLLIDSAGQLRCAAQPAPEDRSVSDAALHILQDQVRRGHLKFGVLTIDQFAGRWVSTMTIPLRSNATLTLIALPELVAKEALPPEAVVTITNRDGIILARSADQLRWAGRSARGRGVTVENEGTTEAIGVDGVSRQYGFTFVPQLGWYVSVGIPTAAVMGPVRRLYVEGLIAGFVVIFVACVVALILSRRVERPINELAAGASSVARGAFDKIHSPRQAPREVAMLADAFNEMVERLKALSERLIEIQEGERARISRAIHDDLGQSLTALKMDVLGLLEKNRIPASPTIERIQRTLDSTVAAVQQIAKELRPSMLDDLGLAAVLEAEVRVFEERTGIECELSLPEGDFELDAVTSTVLYRIIQEALTNVLRHSNASRVEIRLRIRGDEILLEIRDDGRGITSGEIRSAASLGLIGIRERAAMVGGTADFEGVAGRGTIVSVRIPAGDRVKAAS